MKIKRRDNGKALKFRKQLVESKIIGNSYRAK